LHNRLDPVNVGRIEAEARRNLVALSDWNANSHADRHGQDCSPDPAMHHSSEADLTAALHR
jgi:hypothetical protein